MCVCHNVCICNQGNRCGSRCCQYTWLISELACCINAGPQGSDNPLHRVTNHCTVTTSHCTMTIKHCTVTTCNGSGLCLQNMSKHVSMIALHRLFGGARLEMMTSKDSRITFADIAGIDQVKAEIIELVQFLKNPKKFTDLGARSPAGVLLVGPPGTGDSSLTPPTHSTCTHILQPCSQYFSFCRGVGAMRECMHEQLYLCIQLACHNCQRCLALFVASGNCGDVCSL